MRIVRLHVSHWIIALAFALSAGALPGWVPAAVAQDDDPEFSAEDLATFATILAAQSQVVPLAGPFTANLTEEQSADRLAWADVELADFHARAVFAVPDAASDVPWDIGFMFRSSPDGTLRVAIDSRGNWYLSRGTGAPAVTGRPAGVVTEGEARTRSNSSSPTTARSSA